jgi:hypothetical protein
LPCCDKLKLLDDLSNVFEHKHQSRCR